MKTIIERDLEQLFYLLFDIFTFKLFVTVCLWIGNTILIAYIAGDITLTSPDFRLSLALFLSLIIPSIYIFMEGER